jgi:YVTN family beta-propeller protein
MLVQMSPRKERHVNAHSTLRASTLLLLASIAVAAFAAASSAAGRKLPARAVLVAKIPVATPRDVTAGFGSIWVANGPSKSVTRIDPATHAVTATIPVPNPASVLAVGAGAVWLTSYPGNSVTRIDPATNTALDTISAGDLGPIGITFFHGYVWVANHDGTSTGSVAKIDPKARPMRIVDRIPVGTDPTAGPSWIAGAAGSLWVSVPNVPAVVRINPKTDAITATIPDKGVCGELVASARYVWVAGGDGDDGCLPGITRIDPRSNTVTDSIYPGGNIDALALGAGGLWFGATPRNTLGRVDPKSDSIVGRLALPGPAFGAKAAYGFVWITDTQDNVLFQVRPHRRR